MHTASHQHSNWKGQSLSMPGNVGERVYGCVLKQANPTCHGLSLCFLFNATTSKSFQVYPGRGRAASQAQASVENSFRGQAASARLLGQNTSTYCKQFHTFGHLLVPYYGWTKSCTTWKPWLKPLFVGLYRRIILPGSLRWCRILSIHSMTGQKTKNMRMGEAV